MKEYKCSLCKLELEENEAYEYRGFHSCEDHFDEIIEKVDSKRNGIIEENDRKTAPLKGLDIRSDSIIGKENRKLLAGKISACSVESLAEKEYRNGVL